MLPGLSGTWAEADRPRCTWQKSSEERFTIRAPGALCFIQTNPGPQLYLICIDCNTMTRSWSAGCAVSPPRNKSACKMQLKDLAKVLCTRWLRWHGYVKHRDGCLKKVQKLNPIVCRGCGHPRETWTKVIGMDCLALGVVEIHPSNKKACSGRFRSAVRLLGTY